GSGSTGSGAGGSDVKGADMAGSGGSAGGSTVPTAMLVAPTDAAGGGLPEELAVRDGKAYLEFAPTSQICALDRAGGATTPFSTPPTPVAGKGFMTGLAFSGADLYAALVSFVPEVQAGIYRASERGKPATLFAKHAEMAFPNGLAFDPSG